MKIKICGLKREEDILYANEVLPDYVGFVFAGTKRRVSFEQAAHLRELLDKRIQAVGVFVDEAPANVQKLLKQGIIDMAQLHGNETEEEIRKLRESSKKPVIKAVKVTRCEDVKRWLSSKADYLLFDSGQGTGKTFDWKLLEDAEHSGRPYFLAGGLNLDNMEEALRVIHPYCMDVSSGAETDGYKDLEKMRRLTRLCRKWQ